MINQRRPSLPSALHFAEQTVAHAKSDLKELVDIENFENNRRVFDVFEQTRVSGFRVQRFRDSGVRVRRITESSSRGSSSEAIIAQGGKCAKTLSGATRGLRWCWRRRAWGERAPPGTVEFGNLERKT